MSGYKDFVRDFPVRCKEVLEMSDLPALSSGREVTLSLIVASAAIVVPFERLRITDAPHSAGDRRRFPQASKKFDKLQKGGFTSSVLCKESSEWRYGETDVSDMDPERWPEFLPAESIPGTKDVRSILSTVRNALAHGSIFTRGGTEIEEIIFVSRRRRDEAGFRFVAVSPRGFRDFLDSWLNFVEEFPMKCEEWDSIMGDCD